MTKNKFVTPPKTLTDRMRKLTGGLTSTLGRYLHSLGVHPDVLTLIGTIAVSIAALLISQGEFFWGGALLLVSLPLDALDGAVARAMGRQDKFGAFWDSTLDRYSDGFIFMGLAYYYSTQDNQTAVVLSLAAMLGTQLVSYTRARAEGLRVDCKVGLLTRMERVFILLAMLFTGWVIAGLWVLAIGTHITTIQRIWHVRGLLNAQAQGEPTS